MTGGGEVVAIKPSGGGDTERHDETGMTADRAVRVPIPMVRPPYP